MIRPRPKWLKTEQEQIERMAKAVAKLRAHGVQVLFVRLPSSGDLSRIREAAISAGQAPGTCCSARPGRPESTSRTTRSCRAITLPEWSHIAAPEAERFTAALYRVVERDFWGPGAPHAPAAAASPAQ